MLRSAMPDRLRHPCCIVLLLGLMLNLTNCAVVRRHPLATGIVTGVAVGLTIAAIEHRGKCPGEYVSGDPPCPPPSDAAARGR